ncbi:hypothetical protein HR51_30420 [Burkholderia cepacia]|nr:hypothetical protein HR51_30420 [Burkholderia cepacia]
MNPDLGKKQNDAAENAASQPARARLGSAVSNYQKLLQHPTAALVGHVDDSPHSAHVAILGYN